MTDLPGSAGGTHDRTEEMAGGSLARPYWLLWSATAAASLGDGIRLSAVPLLAAALTRDPLLVAGLTAATTLPWVLFGLVAGAIVDRVDRRGVLVWVNVFRAGAFATLALAVVHDFTSLPLLYAVAFAVGTAETLMDSATPTMVPAVVPRERLEDANGRLAMAQTSANEFAGPPLGSFLFAVSAATAFVANAATFALAAALAVALRGVLQGSSRAPQRTSVRRSILDGLRWLASHELLRALTVIVAVFAFVDAAWFSILVLFAIDVLGTSSFGFGALLLAGAVGSVLAGLVASRLSRRFGVGASLLASLLFAAVAQLVIGLTSSMYVAGAMLALSGGAFTVWNVLNVSLRQRLVPDELLGRVNSAYLLAGFAAALVGALAGGVLAQFLGLRAPFLLGAPILFLLAIAARSRVTDSAVAAAKREA